MWKLWISSFDSILFQYHAGVFLADYGETKFFSTSEIRRLADEFKSLPLQAVKGALAGIYMAFHF